MDSDLHEHEPLRLEFNLRSQIYVITCTFLINQIPWGAANLSKESKRTCKMLLEMK